MAEQVLLTAWAGGLWSVGFVVAPLLFAQLDDRALAGTLAGGLFAIVARAGLVCGACLIVIELLLRPVRRWRIGVLSLMLLLVAGGHFVLTPVISAMRDTGQVDSTRFAMLHGVAGVLYLLTSLLALWLVATGPRRL